MLNDTQQQRERLEALWTMLTRSSGATEDVLTSLMDLVTVTIGLVNRVDELQGEVGELKAQIGKRDYCPQCEGSLTSADYEAGCCTQCGTSLTNRK